MSFVYINGEYKNADQNLISHRDCGFTTGIGVFDSMLGVDKNPVHPQDHFKRLMHDAKTVIGIKPDLSFTDFKTIIETLIEKNDLGDGYIRIRSTVTGGQVEGPLALAKKPTILIDVGESRGPKDIGPVTCAIIPDYPRIAGCELENCKRVDYSRSYTARQKAKSMGADEAILTNTEGNVACGATSNIFIEENGKLITPPLSDGVLAGVTRKNIIQKKEVREESISVERLKNADKAYLTNSFIGLREIKQIL
jgi:branched-subunit amino acid aminotransferase/4-amino-4-deoxychorismate lyase